MTSYGSGDESIDESENDSELDYEATHGTPEVENSDINAGMYGYRHSLSCMVLTYLCSQKLQ